MHVALTISDKGVVEEAMFNGDGCAISQAAASLLMVHILNKTIDELRIMTPGTIYSLLGVEVGPSRVQCALLAYETLSQALRKLDQSA
jgi:nitrogen fixation NifU-like protein